MLSHHWRNGCSYYLQVSGENCVSYVELQFVFVSSDLVFCLRFCIWSWFLFQVFFQSRCKCMAKFFSTCLSKRCVVSIFVGLISVFLECKYLISSLILMDGILCCVFVGWGDVGYVYVGVVGSWLFLRHCLLQQQLALQLYSLLFRS